MTKRQFQKLIDRYEKSVEKTKIERPLTEQEINDITQTIREGNLPSSYSDSFNLAVNGNFSRFEELPYLIRNYLGAHEMQKIRNAYGEISLENEGVRTYLQNNSMNAALRAGISAAKNGEETKELAKELDTFINKSIMQKTMLPPSEQQKSALTTALGENGARDALEQNAQKQLLMARTMLLAQLGKYELTNKHGLHEELNEPLTETLAHGSRTNFILPPGEENSNVIISALKGRAGGMDAGLNKRSAATHSVKLRKVDASGMIASDTKEEKTKNPFKVGKNQFGMDISTGGIGSVAPNGKTVTGNGESGHVYMRIEAGDENHCGSILMGIEGSAPGKSSPLGKAHTIRAIPAKQSAFLADKTIIGQKIGGRRVDLSAVNAQDLASVMRTFSQKYGDLQSKANNDPTAREQLASINDMLMGKRLDENQLKDMFNTLGFNDPKLDSVIADARHGYTKNIKADETTRGKFEQSIRAAIAQEDACKLAKARFNASGEDKTLAVGAVRELMYTHETRSKSWRRWHPIKNYRENALISKLLKKLGTEKNMSKAEISSLLSSTKDSFSLNYGNGLSNDGNAVKFIADNKNAFRPDDAALTGGVTGKYFEYKAPKNATSEINRNNEPASNVNDVKKKIDERLRTQIKVEAANHQNQNDKKSEKADEYPPPTKHKNV